MTMRRVYNSKNRQVFKDDKTGQVKEVILDDKHKESVKRGDHLQPYGKDEDRFFDTYKHLGKQHDGKIVDKRKDKTRRDEEARESESDERAKWERRKKMKSPYDGKRVFFGKKYKGV